MTNVIEVARLRKRFGRAAPGRRRPACSARRWLSFRRRW